MSQAVKFDEMERIAYTHTLLWLDSIRDALALQVARTVLKTASEQHEPRERACKLVFDVVSLQSKGPGCPRWSAQRAASSSSDAAGD